MINNKQLTKSKNADFCLPSISLQRLIRIFEDGQHKSDIQKLGRQLNSMDMYPFELTRGNTLLLDKTAGVSEKKRDTFDLQKMFVNPMEIDTSSIANTKYRVIRSGALALIMLGMVAAFPAWAHRGSADEIDTCQIRVGSEKVHFTAYTPTFTQSQEYCRSIPNVGTTNLVFDYEGHKLRNISVEFEVTKEPEGTRVFYQEPKKIKTGTVNGVVDFSQFGAGKYLAHVTIVHEGETLDTHLPFWVGVEAESPGLMSSTLFGKTLLWVTISLALVYFLFQLYRAKGVKGTSTESSE
ncbi:MAG: hypothetical protein ACU84J_14335 [Gammaproteobacteria bacterium]